MSIQKLGVASQRAEVAEDRGFRTAHIIHEDHGVRHAVEVHHHGDLNEAPQAGPATLAGLGRVQFGTEMRRKNVAAVRDSGKEDKASHDQCQGKYTVLHIKHASKIHNAKEAPKMSLKPSSHRFTHTSQHFTFTTFHSRKWNSGLNPTVSFNPKQHF